VILEPPNRKTARRRSLRRLGAKLRIIFGCIRMRNGSGYLGCCSPIQCGMSATCPPAQDDRVTHARHRNAVLSVIPEPHIRTRAFGVIFPEPCFCGADIYEDCHCGSLLSFRTRRQIVLSVSSRNRCGHYRIWKISLGASAGPGTVSRQPRQPPKWTIFATLRRNQPSSLS
jgi:hypothetical protein